MNLVEHTINWHKGEAFEAILTGLFGLIIILLTIGIWWFGKTPNDKALGFPLFLVGLLFVAAGGMGYISNTNAAKALTQSEVINPEAYIELEKERVKGFQYMYMYTKIGAAVVFSIAMLLFFFTDNRHAQAIAISLIMLGITGLVIDYFSKERADHYYQIIQTYNA